MVNLCYTPQARTAREVQDHRPALGRLLIAGIAGALSLGLVVIGAHAQPQAGQWPLTFTRGQADDGQVIYRSSCASCHGANLEGAAGPALTGAAFDKWRSGSVGQFYNLIVATMPAERPGSLTPKAYLSLLAFIALRNGFVPGPYPLAEVELLGLMGFHQ